MTMPPLLSWLCFVVACTALLPTEKLFTIDASCEPYIEDITTAFSRSFTLVCLSTLYGHFARSFRSLIQIQEAQVSLQALTRMDWKKMKPSKYDQVVYTTREKSQILVPPFCWTYGYSTGSSILSSSRIGCLRPQHYIRYELAHIMN